ncbi:head GIN domain-containing protein [Fibrella aquatica]|uniref:head GIN domain-containing protein n=1 Tax=Fibrella aquatica TaxID=3242487 RepID=UPI00351FDAB8
MKMNGMRLLVAFFALAISPIYAQNVTLNPKVADFSVLKVSSGVQVFLTQGDAESVKIEAKGFEEKDIVAEVDGRELKISIRLQGWLGKNKADKNTNRYVKAYVTARQLNEITVSAGAQLTGETPFQAEKIGLFAKSGSQLTMNLQATDVELSSGAGSTATVEGAAKTVIASASAGATIDAKALTSNTTQAEATSGATVRVYAENELFMKASTGGSVTHSGPGRIVSRKTSLGGSAD